MLSISQKQHLLAFLGYYRIPVDGIWGPGSAAAVKEFQQAYGLEADGVFGPRTEEKLRRVIGDDLSPEKPEDPWEKIRYFDRAEFGCKCGGKYCSGFPVEPDPEMVRLLDQVRAHFGVPIVPHSGIRCRRHNQAVGGSPQSRHLLGMAVDFHVDGVSPETVRDYVETLLPDTGGIGIYSWGIHMDTRKEKARWDSRQEGWSWKR